MKGNGRLVGSIVVVAVLVASAITGFLTSLRPLLGLDLVGGLSVILEAPSGTSRDTMELVVDKIRERVDALGVAEPDIALVGNNLVQVQLPGLGGQGKVEKRGAKFCAVSSSGTLLDCYDTQAAATARAKAQSVQRVLALIGRTARLEEREVLQTLTPATDKKSPYVTTAFTTGVLPAGQKLCQKKPCAEGAPDKGGLVTYEDSDKNGQFTFGVDPKYVLGKIEITGDALDRATAQYVPSSSNNGNTQAGWRVVFNLNKEGSKKFAAVTTRLVNKQLAIVLDKVVQSAPTIKSAITGGQGEITGNFSEAEAKNLAVILNSGALPVQLTRQEVRTVSPTLGKESLRLGLLAGIIGLVALMLYLAFYYRLLGVVTWFGMAIWAVLAIALVSLLGRTVGYALTLAGIAGIVVSLGITADSYIVFYERLKDEVRHGKTLRSAVVPAFRRSWRTIYTADIVTILAAGILYMLSIGSVRGFALTLGLSTLLDLFVVYFFKRPTVFLISRNAKIANLRGVGIRSGVAADPVPVAGGAR